MHTRQGTASKYVLGFLVCLAIRLIPFRPPNIEPILATLMPYSKAYGPKAGFLFAAGSMLSFDIITGKVGPWTFITALSYGIVGFCAAYFLTRFGNRRRGYIAFAIIGTLFFDITTGFTVGPLFFNQPLSAAVIGQIPFTALHLLGNITFASILSPALYRHVIENKTLEKYSFTNLIHTFV